MMIFKIIAFLFLVFIFPYAASLSFDFESFSPSDPDIIYKLEANVVDHVIQLTEFDIKSNPNSTIGRATYAKPLYLWDKSSSNLTVLTDFTTHFSFSISSLSEHSSGGGLAFFLVPNDSSIPSDALASTFGLTSYDAAPGGSFVAVEFDVYQSEWDDEPVDGEPYEHVGIDLNTVRSSSTKPWFCGNTTREGVVHNVSISYDSKSTNLTVIFTAFNDDTWFNESLTYPVDLRFFLTQYVNIGFSAGTDHNKARHTINSWSFHSTLDLPSEPEPPKDTPPDFSASQPHISGTQDATKVARDKSTSKTGLITGLSVGCLTVLLVVALVMYFCLCKKSRRTEKKLEEPSSISMICNDVRQDASPVEFTYDDLKEATNNFAEDNKLGEGGFGSVYKGCLRKTNSVIAVKRISSDSMQGIREYATEVKIISTLRHKSLVKLLGWCHERKQELLLVYEFMPNGSLDFHLFNKANLLNWGTRMKIAKGLASALLYLHEMCEHCVLHRDIKSGNIMLDENFKVKLGDFGLARMVDHQKGYKTTVNVSGTRGYMAPEYINTCIASKETDVFSFGVVALEIATGKRAIHITEQGPVNLVEWAWSLYGTGKLLEAVDPRLGSDINRSDISRLMTVGLWCAHPDMNSRPSMSVVARVLDCEASLPDLPPSMPSAPAHNYASTQDLLNISESLNRSDTLSAVSATSLSSATGQST